MSNEKRIPLTEDTMNEVAGGQAGTVRLFYVELFGGEDVAGPFHTKGEAQQMMNTLSLKYPNERYILTYTDVPA